MQALQIRDGALAMADVPAPAAAGECVIRVRLAGVCGTDLALLDGYAGFTGTPGHEFVGVVEETAPGDERWRNRRVVGEISVGCGACAWCRRAGPGHCRTRSVLGIRGRAGAFAERLRLPAANLHEVPEGLDDRQAVFVEPVAAACRAVEQARLGRTDRVAVLGDGRLGLLVAQVARGTGAEVAVEGRHPDKLDVARALGLRAAGAGESGWDEGSCDAVVDATGHPSGLERACRLVRPGGRIVLKSTGTEPARLDVARLVVDEVELLGSRCGSFPEAIDCLRTGRVRTAPLVSRVLPLERYEEAFAAARRELKVLFRISV